MEPAQMEDINRTSIIKDQRRGNGLAATSKISPGQVIIRINSPFLLVVENNALDRICAYCLWEATSETVTLKRCSRCKVPRYCSPACQRADWRAIHQKECALLKTLPDVPPTAVRALMHCLIQHKQATPKLDPAWADLDSHIGDLQRSKDRWDDIVLLCNAAIKFSRSSPDMVEVARQLHCRITCNAFRATLADETPIGLCFEPTLALANHSCEPNAYVVFDGRVVSLRALSQIEKGEQIFVSYIDPTLEKAIRNAELAERYFFTCHCVRCEGDSSVYESYLRCRLGGSRKSDLLYLPKAATSSAAAKLEAPSKKRVADHTALWFILNESKHIPDNKQRLQRLKSALRSTDSYDLAVPPFPQIIHEIFLGCLGLGNFFHALIILLYRHLHRDIFAYPHPHHPTRVTSLFTIAKLLKFVASLDPKDIIEPVPENGKLIEILKKTDLIDAFHATTILARDEGVSCHGEESRFVKDVDQELVEVEEVQRLRGGTGKQLRAWQSSSTDGRKEASLVFGRMRELAGCFEDVIRPR